MFSAQIVQSDTFLEMPISCHGLYFHLGIEADDDGFVSPRKVLRMIGGGEDDLKILIAKNFVIPFETGVIVITHWKQNNYIQKDRYNPTIYRVERNRLSCVHNVYNLDTLGIHGVSVVDTQVGRKGGNKEEGSFVKNEDQLSSTRKDEHFQKGREILGKRRSTA